MSQTTINNGDQGLVVRNALNTMFGELYLRDFLASLGQAEVSITGATTLTSSAFGRMHVCSGTSADYSVGLPAVSGNAGKFIGFRMASGLTKLVTLDGNGSETIDGVLTRIMWAQESSILFCDGTAWTKLFGRTVPMICSAYNSSVSYGANAATTVSLTAADSGLDDAGLYSSSDSAIKIKRPGKYQAVAYASAGDSVAAGSYWEPSLLVNGSQTGGATAYSVSSSVGVFVGHHITMVQLASADLLKPVVYSSTAANSRAIPAQYPRLVVTEVPSW